VALNMNLYLARDKPRDLALLDEIPQARRAVQPALGARRPK